MGGIRDVGIAALPGRELEYNFNLEHASKQDTIGLLAVAEPSSNEQVYMAREPGRFERRWVANTIGCSTKPIHCSQLGHHFQSL